MRSINMRSIKVLAITALAAVVSSCVSPHKEVPTVAQMLSEETGQNGRACVRKSDIRGYGVLKNKVVSIDGRRNYYLATVLPGCNDLSTSIGAIFSGNFYEICGQSMDKIVTQDDYCTINKIYEFDNREEAFAIYNALVEKREELKASAEAQDEGE